jgi:5-methylthioribose kinase
MENILNTIKVVLNEIAVEILNPEIAQYFPVVLDTFFIIAALYLSWTCFSIKKY